MTQAKVERTVIADFVSHKNIAVIGASSDNGKFGNYAYRELKKRGYHVIPVNPKTDVIAEDRCYPDLKSLPERVDGVLVVVPPEQTEKVVQEAESVGIKRIWMQQGAASEAAINFCRQHGLSEVHGECILMFAEPVASYHRWHRGLMGCFGLLPK